MRVRAEAVREALGAVLQHAQVGLGALVRLLGARRIVRGRVGDQVERGGRDVDAQQHARAAKV